MSGRSSVYRALRAFELQVVRVEKILLFIAMLAILACIGLGIFFRVARMSVPWTNEAAQILLIWLMFIGANLGFYYSEHVGMTALVDRLGRRLRLACLALVQIGLIAFCLYIIVVGSWFVSFQQMMGGTTIALPFDLPKWVIAAGLPISFAAGLLHVTMQFFDLEVRADATDIPPIEGAVIPTPHMQKGDAR